MKFVEEKVKCNICQDRGWVYKDGGVVKCECQYNLNNFQVNSSLNIPKKYFHASLDNFLDAGIYSRKLILEKIKEYIYSDEIDEGRGFFFYGRNGVGKTHLAVAILKELYKLKGITGMFYDTRILLYDLKATFEGNSSTRELLDSVVKAPILVLDDLGQERLSDWAKDILHYVIISRYNEKLPVIITSNISLEKENGKDITEDVESRFGKGITSRLMEMCYPIFVEGEDFRKATIHKNLRRL
ncbi:ATP-binding protein [Sulfurihydrogenibium sp.]|uniref:ATP-binding protein n=1 Tax=Sulfurihydrogenibium sp. TaxID=2053621 RepID=UPI00261F57D5|nr:ATP-binding protein [Sulfurihydrogenibium sp.]